MSKSKKFQEEVPSGYYPRPKFDEFGREIPDPTPVAVPAGFRKPPTLQEQIRSLVRHESYQRLVDSGEVESFEEADDLDDFEEDVRTPFEHDADELDLRQTYRREIEIEKRDRADKKRVNDEAIRRGHVKKKPEPFYEKYQKELKGKSKKGDDAPED